MTRQMKAALGLLLILAAGAAAADPIKDSVLQDYRAGWYPNRHKEKLVACQDICRLEVNGVAEHESPALLMRDAVHVCRVQYRSGISKPFLGERFSYGNQVGTEPVCRASDASGKILSVKEFHCLCIADKACTGPDLIVSRIDRPVWDAANHRSVVTAEIRNVGTADAAPSIARVIDPSTTQPSSGAPYNAIANTPLLAAGTSVIVTFYLPYWVFNPDAELEVTADYKGMVQECNEENNVLTFRQQG